jgi:PAS domain-containing protein
MPADALGAGEALPQRDVEIILLKQLASYLAMPIFVIGPEGELVFFNESAESILGRRFDETGEMDREEWSDLLQASDAAGLPVPEGERPLLAALDRREPAHRHFWLRGLDGVRREIEGTAIPLEGQGQRDLGALAFFWEPGAGGLGDGSGEIASVSSRPYEVETILSRRLASTLAMPIFIVDANGHLLYFNEAAEPILGHRFDAFIEKHRDEVYATYTPTCEDGSPMKPEDHPLTIARVSHQPAHRRFWIRGFDGRQCRIEGTAVPLVGQSGRMLGALGFFWEIGQS